MRLNTCSGGTVQFTPQAGFQRAASHWWSGSSPVLKHEGARVGNTTTVQQPLFSWQCCSIPSWAITKPPRLMLLPCACHAHCPARSTTAASWSSLCLARRGHILSACRHAWERAHVLRRIFFLFPPYKVT